LLLLLLLQLLALLLLLLLLLALALQVVVLGRVPAGLHTESTANHSSGGSSNQPATPIQHSKHVLKVHVRHCCE
jgi:hypothetical protein